MYAVVERGFKRPNGPAQGQSDKWCEGEPNPKDGLGEEGECAVSVPLTLDLFEDEIASGDPTEQGQFGDAFARAGLHRPQDRPGEDSQYAERCEQPRGLQMAMGDRAFGPGERGKRVGALVNGQYAHTSEENRIDSLHVSRVGHATLFDAAGGPKPHRTKSQCAVFGRCGTTFGGRI